MPNLIRLEECRLGGSDGYEMRALARLIKWSMEKFFIVFVFRRRRS